MTAEVTPLHAALSASFEPGPTAADLAAVAAAFGQVDSAHRRLRTRLAHRLGLTVTDLTALMVISDLDECTPKHLAAELGLTSGAVTTVIDRLVDARQARRTPKAGDRRSVVVDLTAEGAATIDTVSGLYLGAISLAVAASPHVFNRNILDSLRSTADAIDQTVGAASGSATATARLA